MKGWGGPPLCLLVSNHCTTAWRYLSCCAWHGQLMLYAMVDSVLQFCVGGAPPNKNLSRASAGAAAVALGYCCTAQQCGLTLLFSVHVCAQLFSLRLLNVVPCTTGRIACQASYIEIFKALIDSASTLQTLCNTSYETCRQLPVHVAEL